MRTGALRTTAVALLLAASACGKDPPKPARPPAPTATVAPSASATASAASPAPSASAAYVATPATSGSAAAPVTIAFNYDAGVNACRRVFGPMQQPFFGEVALVPVDGGVLLVTHKNGVPTVTRVMATDAALPPPVAVDAGLARVSSPPCAVTGTFSFCMDPAGAIHRRPLEVEGADVVVARGRPGTAFAAELVDDKRVVVVYLADRRTTEGMVSEAYGVLDDGPPLRLSDEGSGTTYVSLAHRGGALLALLLDGRVAMTPVHARTITSAGGKLLAGEDAVVFVGGGAEPNTRGTLATAANGGAFALIPIAGETSFGLVSVRLDDPPKLDEPSTVSTYLNGLDPAPIAATRDLTPIRVARVRPLEARADGPRGLELGKLDDTGAFVSYGLVGSRGRVTSVALADDHAGSLWLAFTDGTGTWLERRSCP